MEYEILHMSRDIFQEDAFQDLGLAMRRHTVFQYVTQFYQANARMVTQVRLRTLPFPGK